MTFFSKWPTCSKLTLKSLVCLFIFFGSANLRAQELNCRVQVQRPNIQGIDFSIFTNMEKEINEFMNQRRWTDHNYLPEERIKCQITIILTELPQNDRMQGTAQIQVFRPVLNSSHETVSLNYLDKDFNVTYVPFQTIQFSENSYVNNISSLLTFYALMILGTDYDTFQQDGGAPYYERARNVLNLAVTGREGGWEAMSGSDKSRNRYWLVENMMNNSYKAIHSVLYKYHRLGFDKMAEDVDAGRKAIVEALKDLHKLYTQNPNCYAVRVFLDAKAVVNTNEIVLIFKNAQDADKKQVIALMTQIDTKNAAAYNELMKVSGN